MIISKDSFWTRYRNRRKYSAEEEFYLQIRKNRVWPFEDLGNGFYYLQLKSGRAQTGISLIIVTAFATAYFFIVSGVFSFIVCVSTILFVCGFVCLLGKLTSHELIISRQAGYILRLAATRKVLVEQEIYNVYIRLQKKVDSIQMEHFYLIIGGYLLDDIRITRMTGNEAVMRALGRHLGKNLGINYFDYHDETVKHTVYHFRGYSTKAWKQQHDIDVLFNPQSTKPNDMTSMSVNAFEGMSNNTTNTAKSGPSGKQK